MVKLEINECACSKRGVIYCRFDRGYRFTGEKCGELGRKLKRRD